MGRQNLWVMKYQRAASIYIFFYFNKSKEFSFDSSASVYFSYLLETTAGPTKQCRGSQLAYPWLNPTLKIMYFANSAFLSRRTPTFLFGTTEKSLSVSECLISRDPKKHYRNHSYQEVTLNVWERIIRLIGKTDNLTVIYCIRSWKHIWARHTSRGQW